MDNPSHPWKALKRAAFTAIVTHLIGGISMLLILRQGLETNSDLTNRLHFLTEHKALWIAGWLPWSAAALSILYFYACFARAHCTSRTAGRLAVLLTLIGIAFDLSAHGIEIFMIPSLAERAISHPLDTTDFLSIHRTAMMLTGLTANGLYSLSAILLTGMTWSIYPTWLRIAGLGVGVFGLAVSAAVFINSVSGMFWTNAILVPCILAWQMGIAIHAMKHENPPCKRIPQPSDP
jgi:hypothetical protein